MRLLLVYLSMFTTKWAKLGLTDEDLRDLENLLMRNPVAGPVIPGTGGLRKIRFAPPGWNTGKRGASRVIYAYILEGQAAYLFTVYGKNEQADLTQDEKVVFSRVLARLHRRYY